MTTFVKICGLTDEDAVAAAVAGGADAVGFVFFDKSPRNLDPEQAAALSADVPANIRRVAVLLHPDQELWTKVERVFRPDVIQTDADDFSYLDVADGIEKWPVLREGAVPEHEPLPEVFIYEGRRSGHGETVDWKLASRLAGSGRMILAGGLTVANVESAIMQVAPYGVDVSSAVESQPGVKDVTKIEAFIQAAKAA